MKDSRFTELVNLYIDQQITPEETAELESELQVNPQRRRVYRDYCRMHSASKLVYESFRRHAGAEEGAAPVGTGTIERIQIRRRQLRSRWAYYAGGLAAAAACVAFVVTRSTEVPAEARFAATEPVQSSPDFARANGAVAVPVRLSEESVPGPVSLNHPLAVAAHYHELVDAIREEEQRKMLANFQLMTAPNAQEASLFDDEVFRSGPLLPNQAPRTYRGRRGAPNQPPVEFTAFQFQR